LPVTVSVAPCVSVVALSEMDGVSCCTVMAALAERLLVWPVAIIVCAPAAVL